MSETGGNQASGPGEELVDEPTGPALDPEPDPNNEWEESAAGRGSDEDTSDDTSEGTSDDTSEGTSDDTSEGTSDDTSDDSSDEG